MTDKKLAPDEQRPSTEQRVAKDTASEVTAKSAANKSTADRSAHQARSTSTATGQTSKQASSNVALLALLFAVIALATVAGLFYWFLQQQQLMAGQWLQQNQQQQQILSATQDELAQQQQALFTRQLDAALAQANSNTDAKIIPLEAAIKRMTQRQPGDWLVHESEYLIRMAARTLWLEKDTRAAIGLLTDADNRLTELNDPGFLPVRQLIQQDIEQLRLIPTVQTDEVVLALQALNQQLNTLVLAMVHLPDSSEAMESLELSTTTDDWRANLRKSWRKFLADFITVRRRAGNVEPLMTPDHQQNLRENLSLKIQLAVWAASGENTALYQQSLDDVTQWLTTYFEMSNETNLHFIERIQLLKLKNISFAYPDTLLSLSAIRALVDRQPAIEAPLDNLDNDNLDNDNLEKDKPANSNAPKADATAEQPMSESPVSAGEL